MTQKEKAALVRILVDLIKADNVIDEGEMDYYARLKEKYGIRREDELTAFTLPLASAVTTLAAAEKEERDEWMRVFSDMTVSDGFCAKSEAQLMMALRYCLSDEYSGMAEVYSIHEPNVKIEDNQVIYVESEWDEATNAEIRRVYRALEKEFRLGGFDFVYIPHITLHYKQTQPEVMRRIVRFLAPSIPVEQIDPLVEELKNVTTADYCADQLCGRLGMKGLRDAPPSLLIKIGNTYVDNKVYANFLRLTIDEDILPLCQRFVDEFCRMQSSDVRFVSNNEEAHGQFMYHGFYKQLIDIYVVQSGIRSHVLIDFAKGKIFLPQLDAEVKGLHRRDKALYVLLLLESDEGGLNFSLPSTLKQQKAYDERMKRIQQKYCHIYALFDGDKATAPNLADADIRRPIVSNIRRCVGKWNHLLHNAEQYNVTKDSFGHYVVNLSAEMVCVKGFNNDAVPVALLQSHLYTEVKAMK